MQVNTLKDDQLDVNKILYCTGLYFIIIELPIHKLKLLSTVEHKDTDKPAKISNVSVPN